MLVLGLDTATPTSAAALVEVTAVRGSAGAEAVGVRALASWSATDALRTAEVLAVGVREVLAAGRPERVVVGLGPGPFTSLRVGIMTAVAYGDATGLPVHGVCSLDAVPGPVGSAYTVVTDARRREVYWAAYDEAGERVAGPGVVAPASLELRGAPVGPGLGKYAEVLGAGPLDGPDPVRLVARATALGWPAEPLTPLYLRRPDAVEPAAYKAVTPS